MDGPRFPASYGSATITNILYAMKGPLIEYENTLQPTLCVGNAIMRIPSVKARTNLTAG